MNNGHIGAQPLLTCKFTSGIIDQVDQQVRASLSTLNDAVNRVKLDMSRIGSFVESTSLMYLLAIVRDQYRNGRNVSFVLPNDKNVLRFINTHGFLEALQFMRKFGYLEDDGNLIPKENKDAWLMSAYDGISSSKDSLEALFKRKICSIKFLAGHGDSDKPSINHAESEFSRWNEQLIMAWLENNIQGSKIIQDPEEKKDLIRDVFTSRIVYEAVTNAVRHPNASLIATSSMIRDNHLTITWWDDGDGIVNTLRMALAQGGDIISDWPPPPERSIHVRFMDTDSIEKHNTNYVPGSDVDDSHLLLASICARISRDPLGKTHKSKLPESVQEYAPLRGPGMGLYVLIDTSLRTFTGTVSFRTGRHFMHVKRGKIRGKDAADYSAKIVEYDSPFKFPGNMVIVRLPLERKHHS